MQIAAEGDYLSASTDPQATSIARKILAPNALFISSARSNNLSVPPPASLDPQSVCCCSFYGRHRTPQQLLPASPTFSACRHVATHEAIVDTSSLEPQQSVTAVPLGGPARHLYARGCEAAHVHVPFLVTDLIMCDRGVYACTLGGHTSAPHHLRPIFPIDYVPHQVPNSCGSVLLRLAPRSRRHSCSHPSCGAQRPT